MEDSNKDGFKYLEEKTTSSGGDNTSNVPVQYMVHTDATIKKEKYSFYPGEIKQDDGNVTDTVNKDEPCVCNSPGFTHPQMKAMFHM